MFRARRLSAPIMLAGVPPSAESQAHTHTGEQGQRRAVTTTNAPSMNGHLHSGQRAVTDDARLGGTAARTGATGEGDATRMTGLHAHHKPTKDITTAVLALSRGAVPTTPLERLEQWKLATAGERRLRKTATTVWLVIVAHAALMIWHDIAGAAMVGTSPSSPITPGAHANAAAAAAPGTIWSAGSSGSAAYSYGLMALVGHAAHLVHIVYMWQFVQSRIDKAEDQLIGAWEECRLLHCRLPGSRITKDEADDWLAFLKSRRHTSTPHWPARVLSALGVLRFALPILLALNPSGSVSDNVLDAVRTFALGGKYLIYKSKGK